MQSLNRPFTRWGVVALALVVVTSCGASVDATVGYDLRDRLSRWPGLAWLDPVTPIAEIGQSRRGSVYLSGTVERQLPLVGQGLYELSDATGRIWVLTDSSPPAVGSAVSVRVAIQYEQILLRGQDVGAYYAQELERLPPESP